MKPDRMTTKHPARNAFAILIIWLLVQVLADFLSK